MIEVLIDGKSFVPDKDKVTIKLSNGSEFEVGESVMKPGMLRVSPENHNVAVFPTATNVIFLREY